MEKKIILIVEDDAAIAELVTEILNDEPGYVACAVRDPEAAARVLETTRVDLLILDVNLPGDGLALFDRLRLQAATAALPCLFMSARDYRAEVARRGGRDFLPKPFETDELLERVAALLARADGPGAEHG